MISKKLAGGILALILAYYLSSDCSCKKEGKIVETKYGQVKGIISESRDGREFYEWLGIPYAKPPVGKLRFASPQSLDKKWDGIRDGSAYASACAQMDFMIKSIEGKEDCLYLNIHAPKIQDNKKLLPVMFWIHGGYFHAGKVDDTRPEFFMDEDVVLVTITYRLGALGFLTTGDSVVRGNMGLKDQSMALKWVNENIASFGGDPKQITIVGESAGAGAVHFQMLSPMSRGLMQRAISQSGSALNMWAMYDDPVGQAKNFAERLNCPTESSAEMVECLRNVEINDLLEIHRDTTSLTRTKDAFFVPSVEKIIDQDTFLPDFPINIVNSGKMAKIPWLTGVNAEEGLIFANNILTNKDFRRSLENDWVLFADVSLNFNETEKQFRDKVLQFYYGSTKKPDLLRKFNATVNLISDRWFIYGNYKAALSHAQHAPTQFYYYNKIGPSVFDMMVMIQGNYGLSPIAEILLGMATNWFNTVVLGKPQLSYGVCHADEVLMMFEMAQAYDLRKGTPYYEFSKDFVKTWVSFASAKNVADVEFRGTKFPILNPKEEPLIIEIADEPKSQKLPFFLKERIQFWETLHR